MKKKSDLKTFLREYLSKIQPVEYTLCDGCGSCLLGEYTYEDHLQAKTAWLAQTFSDKNIELPNEMEVVPSPKKTRYRNKMDFVAYEGKIGLRRGGFANVYDVMDSCIAPEYMSEVLEIFRKWNEFPDYDLRRHTGTIRYFVLRSSEHEGKMQYMVTIVVHDLPQNMPESLLRFMKEHEIYDKFEVIALALQPTKSDVSFSDDVTFLKGTHIEYDLSVHGETYVYAISPNAFFQSNASVYQIVLEDMANALKKYLATQKVVLYDLYGGTGTIGISLSKFAERIINIEIAKENCQLAERNAIRNNVDNYTVICGDVGKELAKIDFSENSVVILDPPRVGVGEKAIEYFLSMKSLPNMILYMSCNATTQATDLSLLKKEYAIISINGYDMFPFTGHIETLALLIRKPLKG